MVWFLVSNYTCLYVDVYIEIERTKRMREIHRTIHIYIRSKWQTYVKLQLSPKLGAHNLWLKRLYLPSRSEKVNINKKTLQTCDHHPSILLVTNTILLGGSKVTCSFVSKGKGQIIPSHSGKVRGYKIVKSLYTAMEIHHASLCWMKYTNFTFHCVV